MTKSIVLILLVTGMAGLSAAPASDCCCSVVRSTPGDHPGSVAVLLGLDTVRRELRVSKDQAEKLDAIRTAFKVSAGKLVSKGRVSPDASKSASAALEKLKAKSNAEALGVLTPLQRCRMAQLEYQLLGGSMLLSPAVQKTLKLSPAQIARIGRIQQKGQAYTAGVNRKLEAGKITHHEKMAQLRTYRIKQSKSLVGILTPAQKTTLKMLGGQPAKQD